MYAYISLHGAIQIRSQNNRYSRSIYFNLNEVFLGDLREFLMSRYLMIFPLSHRIVFRNLLFTSDYFL